MSNEEWLIIYNNKLIRNYEACVIVQFRQFARQKIYWL